MERANTWTGNSSECQMSRLRFEGDAWEAGSCGSMLKGCSWNTSIMVMLRSKISETPFIWPQQPGSGGDKIGRGSGTVSDPKLACRAHI